MTNTFNAFTHVTSFSHYCTPLECLYFLHFTDEKLRFREIIWLAQGHIEILPTSWIPGSENGTRRSSFVPPSLNQSTSICICWISTGCPIRLQMRKESQKLENPSPRLSICPFSTVLPFFLLFFLSSCKILRRWGKQSWEETERCGQPQAQAHQSPVWERQWRSKLCCQLVSAPSERASKTRWSNQMLTATLQMVECMGFCHYFLNVHKS